MSSDLGVFVTAPISSNVAAFTTTPFSFKTLFGILASSPSSSSSATSVLEATATPSPSSQCYFPNGQSIVNFDYTYQPCGGRNTTWQQCCDPETDICNENGLCTHLADKSSVAFNYRAGCANADWSGCPQVCLDVLSSSWVQVQHCATGEYCCNQRLSDSPTSGNCCDDIDGRQFDLSNHNPNAENTTGAAGGSDEGKKNGTDVSTGGSSKNTTVRIGAAAGGALGGLAVIGGAVGVWLYLRKKRAKQEREMISQEEADVEGPNAMEPLEMKQVLEVGTDLMAGQKCTPGSDVKVHSAVMEMDSTAVYELGG
ncbi:hypothetical protein M441DRAFT_67318 [Trichoderma asperellum CBS 433.97]|uniref:Uncharacterized protein n=1 Tax=Trichoderma asperellum (strain ATCC 204424 / CBS 433.97 / NBRC 101777) TaxID=1042311 RepID=A0A2T3ZFI8_TRIA4|nr:hypothetical protein M441DRAFT_67318 [Trichoderma asperellum CBS 433.97]PTB43571.1 hypothetical protein M441DRAFT_67318 [Trichoderma asperellum CBS 433.97]